MKLGKIALLLIGRFAPIVIGSFLVLSGLSACAPPPAGLKVSEAGCVGSPTKGVPWVEACKAAGGAEQTADVGGGGGD